MGCFLGCFGFSSKRKRRKPANRVQPGEDHRFGSYEPLDSVSAKLDVIVGDPICSDSDSSKKPKESLNDKIRKKVSFNLNVQTYEPIPKLIEEDEEESTGLFWESDVGERKEEISNEDAREGQSKSSSSQEDSIAAKMASYPSNYRYKNCIDSYDDEEDEIAYEEIDLDDEDEDDEFVEDYVSGDDIDELRTSRDEFAEKFSSLSLSSQMRDSLTDENLRPFSEVKSARDRSQYVHSVLNPVENLSQWKALKARGKPQVKRQRKENVASDQNPQMMQDVAVDASLSNWIVSANTRQSITKDKNVESKSSFDGKFPWRSRDDMPILDITNLEV